MDLQKGNGVKYDMRYQSTYTPVVMHFLAKVARNFFKKQWDTAITRALMTDEVKINDAQWLTTSARVFVSDRFLELPVSPARFLGELRDATAIANALQSCFSQHGIQNWVDEKLVAFTTDGASVLQSGLGAQVHKTRSGAQKKICVPQWIAKKNFVSRSGSQKKILCPAVDRVSH